MDKTKLIGEPRLPAWFPLPIDRPFTYKMAQAEGIGERDLRWLVQQGFLRRPIKSVYVAADIPDSLGLRVACLKLVVPDDAVVVDRHAGWLHGAEMVLAPNEHLDLAPVRTFLPPGRRLRNPLTDSGERTLRVEDVTEIDGLPVTTPIRTAWDLGRNRWVEPALSGIDQMLRLGVFSKEELIDGVARFRGMRWVTVLRVVVVIADGRAESPPESVLRLRWIQVHLPTPVPQIEVWDGPDFLARLDLGNEELRFAAEYDGVEWHSSPEQLDHDRRRRRIVEERGGWLVQPFVKEHLYGRNTDAERLLREGAAEARRRLGRRR
ncbi:hypothetical protein [Nocardioides sp. TF02-7]|uniref:hypothetical protein n=1 Tax=Nocardioides sp. TF02-7 TaxID=2917724 RepID=UPI001F0610C6|nr:hypothetical protein [Nocardioides sp. TF02-7]UMG91645.1 hypothetical protein MF408_16340 [Nocardioides sp. TF02-7]